MLDGEFSVSNSHREFIRGVKLRGRECPGEGGALLFYVGGQGGPLC